MSRSTGIRCRLHRNTQWKAKWGTAHPSILRCEKLLAAHVKQDVPRELAWAAIERKYAKEEWEKEAIDLYVHSVNKYSRTLSAQSSIKQKRAVLEKSLTQGVPAEIMLAEEFLQETIKRHGHHSRWTDTAREKVVRAGGLITWDVPQKSTPSKVRTSNSSRDCKREVSGAIAAALANGWSDTDAYRLGRAAHKACKDG